MTTRVEIDTTILNGLPVHVVCHIAPSDPSVGIFSQYLDDFDLYTINKKTKKLTPAGKWLYDKVTEDDCIRFVTEALEKLWDA